MKPTVVVCPTAAETAAVPALARRRPPVLVPFLGRTVLEYALTDLATGGAKQVRLVAEDPTGEIRRTIGRGESWGLDITLTPPGPEALDDASAVRLDHLPQRPDQSLWRSYRDWYEVQLALLPTLAPARVGAREQAPGVFVGLRSQLDPTVRLTGPCWIGDNVFVGGAAVIGPGAIIGDGSYIDGGAEVVGSVVGPQTYVGAFTEVRDSFAWGNELLNLTSGSLTVVTDRFLLSAVHPKRGLLGGLLGMLKSGLDR